jgi:hypothetical protein
VKRLFFCVLLAATFPVTAAAQQPTQELTFGVGLAGAFGGNFIDQPDDLQAVAGSDQTLLVYPGFAGGSIGGGLMAELRYAGVVALELGLLFSNDRGSGFIDNVRVDLGQTAWHLPITVKGMYPGETWRPGFGMGLEFVVPASLRVSTDPVLPTEATRFGGTAGSYSMFTLSGHLEIALPIDGVDLRIPCALRFGLNLGTPATARDRASYELGGADGREVQSVIFVSEWQYQAYATTGLSLWF